MSERIVVRANNKNNSIEVCLDFGESIYDDLLGEFYRAQKERLKQKGWALSPRAFLSLNLYLQNSRNLVTVDFMKYEFMGLPIFVYESATPLLPLFEPEDAARLEYLQMKIGN